MIYSKKPQGNGVQKLTVQVVSDWDVLEPVENEWDQLAQNALERSPSAEAWMLRPALRYLLSGEDVRVLLVYADNGQGDTARLLIGVIPIEIRTRYKGLPIRIVRLWNHKYTLSPAPLLHRDFAADCLRELFRWVRSEYPGSTLIELPELRAESAFFRMLADVMHEDDIGYHVTDIHTRAFFRPRKHVDLYLNAISTAHHRHEMRRQERRLAEMGQLRFKRVEAADDVTAWLEAFVALEMNGWKGQQATAFGSKVGDLAFLEEVAHSAAQCEELMLLGLWLDDKPLALKLNFLCGDGGYTFKIAYDETYSKYSPGVLLELENIRQAHSETNLTWLDSLALRNHPMVNRIWLDRATIVTQLVAPGRTVGKLVLGLLPLLGTAKNMLRSEA
jgi:hypothetical protein